MPLNTSTTSTDTVDGVTLSDEQRDLVTAWCTSGHRVQAAVGRAGTGKTTAMRAAATAWTAAGYRVIGCAVKGEAARQLADDAHIEADTVALLLARADAGQAVLDASTVLIVDEASTLGDRDLLALLRLADANGATIRLIGDTAQHGSVPAGGSYTAIVNQPARRTHRSSPRSGACATPASATEPTSSVTARSPTPSTNSKRPASSCSPTATPTPTPRCSTAGTRAGRPAGHTPWSTAATGNAASSTSSPSSSSPPTATSTSPAP